MAERFKTIDRYEFIIIMAVFLISFFLYMAGAFENIETRLIDYRILQKSTIENYDKIAVVEITDRCLNRISGWPIKRSVIASGIDRIMAGGAKTLAVDILFDGRTNAVEDRELADVISKFRKKIVLASRFDEAASVDDFKNMLITRNLTKPYIFDDPLAPTAEISVAYMNIKAPRGKAGDIIRETLVRETGEILALAAVSKHLDKPVAMLGIPEDHLKKSFFINYFNSYVKSPYVKLPFYDLLTMDTDEVADLIDKKLVFLGVTSNSAGDMYMTPYGDMPGVEIQASLAANIMKGCYSLKTTPVVNLSVLIAALVLVQFYLRFIKVWFDVFFLLASLAANVFISMWLATSSNIFTDITPLSFQIVFQILAIRLYHNIRFIYLLNIELKRKNQELSLMDLINQAIINKTGGELLCEVLNIVVNSIKSERSSILLMSENENKLMLKYVYSTNDKMPMMVKEYISFNVGEGIAGSVAERGDILISNDVKNDERFKVYASEQMNKSVDNLACIALKSDKEVFGVLNIVNKPGGFTEEDRIILQNIADQIAVALQNAKLYELAITDGMTKLYIHRYFQARLESELKRSKRFGQSCSLMMFDIDHFKKFNDTYGHQVGDIVIVSVAQKIVENIRLNIDIPARYGGEEFAVIMPETDIDGAFVVAERLRKSIEENIIEHEGKKLKVNISIGCAEYKSDITGRHQLIQRADSALYRSKEAGRNRTTKWTEEIGIKQEK